MFAKALAGQVAVVTGGGGGLGRAICGKLAELNASCVVVDIQKAAAQQTLDALPSDGVQKHWAVHCDVSSADFVQQLMDHVTQTAGAPPRILVNNAGVTMDARLEKMSEQHWDWVLATNLKGPFLLTQAFARPLIHSGSPGSVINISSIVGKLGNFGQANYSASKAGLIGLTKTCARELGRKGIRVNAVLPGYIRTQMSDKIPEKIQELVVTQIPLGRFGTPEELASVCAFLATDASSYVNGACIEVTGGLGM